MAVVEVVVAEGAEDVVAEMNMHSRDRIGLGWRTELAAGIFAHQDQIDVVEVIAEDWFDAPRWKKSALRTLATNIPVQLHGTSAGLASAAPIEEKRLAKMARLVDQVQPEAWSEHLAFVRAGGSEIGHLASVPRKAGTAADAAANIDRARRVVGTMPMLENIATLIAPPASSLSEVDWLQQVTAISGAPLLLDLHNLYANAVNFESDPATAAFDALRSLPLERVGTVHIAGGRWLAAGYDSPGERRWLDDHLHPVPDVVFSMLEELASLAPQPLTVILERDGAYPPMEEMLLELKLARAAIQRGRKRQFPCSSSPTDHANLVAAGTTASLQALLAGIYVDDGFRAAFLNDPERFAQSHGLNDEDAAALASIDRTGLQMAARSFARKRQMKQGRP